MRDQRRFPWPPRLNDAYSLAKFQNVRGDSSAVYASRRRLDYVWVVLAAAGLSQLLPLTRSGMALDRAGVFYALAAGVGWALYIVFGQKAGQLQGASASTWGLMIAALVTIPVGIADAGGRLFDPAVLPFGLAVAIFSSALPYTMEMIALRRLSTRTFGTLMSFEPAIAALAGVGLLHEQLTGRQWLADRRHHRRVGRSRRR